MPKTNIKQMERKDKTEIGLDADSHYYQNRELGVIDSLTLNIVKKIVEIKRRRALKSQSQKPS